MGGEWSGGGDAAFDFATTGNQHQDNFHRSQQPSFESGNGSKDFDYRSRSRSPVSRDVDYREKVRSGSGFDEPRRSRFDDNGRSHEGRRNRKSRWEDDDREQPGSASMSAGSFASSSVPSLLSPMGSGMPLASAVSGMGMVQGVNMGANIGGLSMPGQGPMMAQPVMGPNPGRGLLGDGAQALMTQRGVPTTQPMNQMITGQMLGMQQQMNPLMQQQLAAQQLNSQNSPQNMMGRQPPQLMSPVSYFFENPAKPT